MKRLLIGLLAGSILVMQAGAQVASRQKAQNARINEGVRSGELTKKEAAKLKRKEAALHREIRQDRKDGPGLTPAERAKIDHKQDKLSREIAKDKHDAQKR